MQVGQKAQVKLAAYPFQKYGMLTGKVVHVSADATEASPSTALANANNSGNNTPAAGLLTYKARVQLDEQALQSPHGGKLVLAPGMQVAAEIHQGKRTVLEYLLSPVQKAVAEAGLER